MQLLEAVAKRQQPIPPCFQPEQRPLAHLRVKSGLLCRNEKPAAQLETAAPPPIAREAIGYAQMLLFFSQDCRRRNDCY
jgi:hypothetical protein